MPSIKRVAGGLWSLAKDISENLNSPTAGDFVVNLRDIDLADGDAIWSGSTGCIISCSGDLLWSEKSGTALFIIGENEIEVSIPSPHEEVETYSSIEWKYLAKIDDDRIDDFKTRLNKIRSLNIQSED